MFGRDVASTRNQSQEHFLTVTKAAALTPAWAFDANRWTHMVNNEVTGYPIVADGCVYVGSSVGNAADYTHLPGWVFALNADTGDVVWQTRIPQGGVYSTLAVDSGVVYAFAAKVSSPTVVALNQATGAILWSTVADHQIGSDALSSPIVYDGMVWVGISGALAEGDEGERTAFQGSTVLLAARPIDAPDFASDQGVPQAGPPTGQMRHYEAGEIIRKLYSIPTSQWEEGYAGAAQWGTISIDPETGFGYEGTGNPFNYSKEHERSNAILKIDLNRSRPTFGQITGSYKGDIEQYIQGPFGENAVPCQELQQIQGFFGGGLECTHLDVDFAATPNIIPDPARPGHKLVVAGQKSGVVHYVDADTMEGIYKVRFGIPSPVGGMVGSAATDGTQIYGAHTVGGYLYDIDGTGTPKWVSPVGDGVHWGPPVTLANGILYTVDLKGFLDGYDASTGLPILHRPMQLGSDPATITNPPLSWAGVTVARHTVYASVGVGVSSAASPSFPLPSMPNGFVIAYRPLVTGLPLPVP
jgi:polyvinyl alcohol dehydrogenase (cytochrome)